MRSLKAGAKSAIVGLVVLAVSPWAAAQEVVPVTREFDGYHAQNFHLPTDPFGYITMNGARSLKGPGGTIAFHAAATANWAHNPVHYDNGSIEKIDDMSYIDLTAGIGLFQLGESGGIQLGINVPLILDLEGHTGNDSTRRTAAGGIGDIRPNMKVTLSDREDSLLGMFFNLYADIPTGEERDYTSNKERWTWGGSVGVEKQVSKFRIGVEAGYEWIDGDIEDADIEVDDKLILKGGLGFEVADELWLVGEIFTHSRTDHLFEHAKEYPVEAGAALHYNGAVGDMFDLYGLLGASAGLNKGVGAPEVRTFAGVGLTF